MRVLIVEWLCAKDKNMVWWELLGERKKKLFMAGDVLKNKKIDSTQPIYDTKKLPILNP